MNHGTYSSQEKNTGIAILLSLFFTGAGQLYAGAVNRGAIQLIIYFILVLFTPLTEGFLLIILIPYWIWGMCDAYAQANIFNSGLIATIEQANKQDREAEEEEAKRTISSVFISQLEKISKLHNVNVLSEEEYQKRKKDLILTLVERKPRESAEDFLAALIPSIERQYLNITDIAQIKKMVF